MQIFLLFGPKIWEVNKALLKLLLHATLVPTPACSLGSSCLQLPAEITPACSLGSRMLAPGSEKNVGKPKKRNNTRCRPQRNAKLTGPCNRECREKFRGQRNRTPPTCLKLLKTDQPSYKCFLIIGYPRRYLIRAKFEDYPLINHSLISTILV